MGIPRDTWAPMPGGGSGKINAAFAYGGGAGQLASVRKVTGLPVEGYVATGFKGFKTIVDQSGGLPIDIAKKIVFLHKLTIPAGKQSLSGKEALAYARERKSLPNGDFGRSAHQSEILLAAAVAARLSGVGDHPQGDVRGVGERGDRPERRRGADLRGLVLQARPPQGGARGRGRVDRHELGRAVDREGELVGAVGVRASSATAGSEGLARWARVRRGSSSGTQQSLRAPRTSACRVRRWSMADAVARLRVDSGAVRAGFGAGPLAWRNR